MVDDNSTNLRLLDTMLRQMGLIPICVDNASEALRRAAEGPPWPLILLDAQMPDMDGVSWRWSFPPCLKPGKARLLCSAP